MGNFWHCSQISSDAISAVCHLTAVNRLDKSISKFWEIEHDVSFNNTLPYTPDEQFCETHFQQTTRRNAEGRFIIKLPMNNERLQQLGDSKEIARRRFLNLEKRLSMQPSVYSRYRKFMQEYISLNHMSEVEDHGKDDKISYYLPHHTVFKESSSTTKLRVVFDASKTTSGLSLNDVLTVGPTLQEDLFSILICFRTFQYAMTADITKMYRQVLIDESQRSLQRIFWRESTQEPLKTFELLTITYGTAPASFLAIRAIRKLAEDESSSFPIGFKLALRDFYVDDLLTGTIQEASEIKEQITKLLKEGGFVLTKWSSNHPSLQDEKNSDGKSLNLIVDYISEIRALGMIWDYNCDVFKFTSIGQLPPLEKPTKRSILSRIALIFDPLGLLGPSVMIAKLMQELWRSSVDWDESISNELHTLWKEYECKLQFLSNIKIPRKVISFEKVQTIQFHGFSDASQKGYGAFIYVRFSQWSH